jgi:predicted enzyme related to lactoylglutathione lyase
MSDPLIKKVDCVRLPVPDLDSGLAFYRDGLGHEVVWRTATSAGLRMPASDAEIVIHTEGSPPETDLLVESAEDATERIVSSGGRLIAGPFDIQIGRCAALADPFGNVLVVLDMSKGRLVTDESGRVIGNERR